MPDSEEIVTEHSVYTITRTNTDPLPMGSTACYRVDVRIRRPSHTHPDAVLDIGTFEYVYPNGYRVVAHPVWLGGGSLAQAHEIIRQRTAPDSSDAL